jgi:hypothetical protein
VVSPVTVHILFHGFPLCAFTLMLPVDWPEGNKWVYNGDPAANCPGCLERAPSVPLMAAGVTSGKPAPSSGR